MKKQTVYPIRAAFCSSKKVTLDKNFVAYHANLSGEPQGRGSGNKWTTEKDDTTVFNLFCEIVWKSIALKLAFLVGMSWVALG